MQALQAMVTISMTVWLGLAHPEGIAAMNAATPADKCGVKVCSHAWVTQRLPAKALAVLQQHTSGVNAQLALP